MVCDPAASEQGPSACVGRWWLKGDSMSIEIVPLDPMEEADPPFHKGLIEYPWQAQAKSIRHGASRKLFAVTQDGRTVGAMAVDLTSNPAQLVFFEITKRLRGQGIGKQALLRLMEMLLRDDFTHLFIQTGRPIIYRNMGFRFIPEERRGVLIDLRRPLIERQVPSGTPMVLVHDEAFSWHETHDLPEKPHRLSDTIQYLSSTGLLSSLAVVAPRHATADEVALVHDPEYVARVKRVSEREGQFGLDTPTCKETYDIARLGFGGALLAGEYLEEWRKVFVLSRPPGHHATRDKAMGFCFFNNIAGLAVFLQKRGYSPMIIDWDAHHGNGTQEILYEEPIPFVSLHQRDLYPWSGTPQERGRGRGLGYTYNFPLPPLCTDDQFLEAASHLPELVERHRPDVLLVSAGQDGYHRDKLSGMMLSAAAYVRITQLVTDLADRYCEGRLVFVLEGGYEPVVSGRLNGLVIATASGLHVTKAEELVSYVHGELA